MMMKIVPAFASTLLLSGCFQTTATFTRIDPPADIEDGTYVLTIDTKDRCSGPLRSYDYRVVVKGGKVVGEPTLLGKAANTGTCQQVLTGVAKGFLPSLVTGIVGMDRNDAIKDAAAMNAAAAVEASKNPRVVDNSTSNLTIQGASAMSNAVSNTAVGVKIHSNDTGFCGNRCGN